MSGVSVSVLDRQGTRYCEEWRRRSHSRKCRGRRYLIPSEKEVAFSSVSHMLPPPQLSSPELPNVPLSILRSPPLKKKQAITHPFSSPIYPHTRHHQTARTQLQTDRDSEPPFPPPPPHVIPTPPETKHIMMLGMYVSTTILKSRRQRQTPTQVPTSIHALDRLAHPRHCQYSCQC